MQWIDWLIIILILVAVIAATMKVRHQAGNGGCSSGCAGCNKACMYQKEK
ncbi:MAG TPA: FeoB-associated Cys-rich membrane protein [Bacillota bacterium]|nr:FeoB-associated Cys-rich membrane protein [Bacillota bacterium]